MRMEEVYQLKFIDFQYIEKQNNVGTYNNETV